MCCTSTWKNWNFTPCTWRCTINHVASNAQQSLIDAEVTKGWKIILIDNQLFSEKLLTKKQDGLENYRIELILETKVPLFLLDYFFDFMMRIKETHFGKNCSFSNMQFIFCHIYCTQTQIYLIVCLSTR
jgi:hypothetical protein